MLHYVHTVITVVKFLSGAKPYLKPDDGLYLSPAEDLVYLYRCYRRILRIAIVFTLSSVVLPGGVPWITMPFRGSTWEDAMGRMLFGLMLALPCILLTICGGAAAGCLFAPTDFMASAAGKRWMKLIGTSKVGVARFVCALVVLSSLGVTAACIGVSMMPSLK